MSLAANPRLDLAGPAPAAFVAPVVGAIDRPRGDIFAIVTRRQDFDALRHEWDALFERAGRPQQVFQTFNWLSHWADHYLPRGEGLAIVTARRDGRLMMAWPLVSWRANGLTRLSWMGEPVGQYGDVLVEEGADAARLLREGWALLQKWGADLVHLRKVRSDSLVAPILAQAGLLTTDKAAAPYLDLASAPDFATYEARYPGKKRSTRRRLLRRLEERGRVRFEQVGPGEPARVLVRQALALKKSWLVRRGFVSPALQDMRFDRFFDTAAAGGMLPVPFRVSVVRCDDVPAAIEISLACKGQVFGHILAYDTAYAKQGIGVLAAGYSIRRAHEQGFSRFDMLAPSDPHKAEWADAAVPVCDYAMGLSAAGRLYVRGWLRHGRPWTKRLLSNLPKRVGSVLSRASDRWHGKAEGRSAKV